jgi:nucleotide-binding universal stress UspA family protein
VTGVTEEIIVGYDGSADSEFALHWAAREASDRGVTLTVCHAWAPEELSLVFEPHVFELARSHGEEIVSRGVQHAEPFAGPGGVQPLLVSGSPARVLCQHSGTATMVVVGARGHGRLAGLLLGSVAWQLAEFGRLLTLWEKQNPDVSVVWQVCQGSPRAVLLEAAAAAQMVIVGTRGRGGIPSMTLGSVTATLLHHAPCPVGIVRPASAA